MSELYKLGEMIDGAELYSRIEERRNADAYIETVNRSSISDVISRILNTNNAVKKWN